MHTRRLVSKSRNTLLGTLFSACYTISLGNSFHFVLQEVCISLKNPTLLHNFPPNLPAFNKILTHTKRQHQIKINKKQRQKVPTKRSDKTTVPDETRPGS